MTFDNDTAATEPLGRQSSQVAELERKIGAISERLKAKELEAAALRARLTEIYQSTSWRLTLPVRRARPLVQEIWQRIRRSFERDREGQPHFRPRRSTAAKKISVVLLSYNHEAYIQECLDSVLMQEGDFEFEIVVGEDCSTDGTPQILARYCQEHDDIMTCLRSDSNLGFGSNLVRCVAACTGDYIAICEGDDYWTDVHKLQKQLAFMAEHPDCSMCFSAIALGLDDQQRLEPYSPQQSLQKDFLTTEDLIEQEWIANLSCCMYRADVLRQVLNDIMRAGRFAAGEWIINMACGRSGRIGFLRERMSVYRIHAQGAWSAKSQIDQLRAARGVMGAYNEFLGHEYDAAFDRLAASTDAAAARILQTQEESVDALAQPPRDRAAVRPQRPSRGKTISVILLSYNHEAYISQCLDGVLLQQGDFDLDVIVGDDHSTDSTPAILAQYQEKHPDLFTLMPPEPNLGSSRNMMRCLAACAGDYIATLEGDDYWTDASKLQKQLEFLEDHPDCPMCFSAVTLAYDQGRRLEPHPGQQGLTKDMLSTEDLIEQNYIANASACMYRAGALRQVLNELVERFPLGDWIIGMTCGRLGPIGFLPERMSVYRQDSQGTWSGQSNIGQLKQIRQAIAAYNEFLGHEYDSAFKKMAAKLDSLIAGASLPGEQSAATRRPDRESGERPG